MKSIFLICVLSISIIGCEQPADPSTGTPETSTPQICSDGQKQIFSACVDSINWKIALKSRAFPKSISVFLNEKLVFNECAGSVDTASVDRTSEKYPVFTLKNYWPIQENQTVNLKIVDCIDLSTNYANPIQATSLKVDPTGKKYVSIEI